MTQSAPAEYLDRDEAARARKKRNESVGKWLLPIVVIAATIFAWDRVVVLNDIPHYILPGPARVLEGPRDGRGPGLCSAM